MRKIEEIINELSGDSKKRQDYIVFSEKERLPILEAEKALRQSKSMTIAVACRFLVESLAEADKTEKKTDGK
ncbi:MAG TPA: hypothetical protein P5548_03910 [Candidatus Moranbacteria bacterium]|nr:hypothetical protein [Candidatus Moranbacteria bacterium]